MPLNQSRRPVPPRPTAPHRPETSVGSDWPAGAGLEVTESGGGEGRGGRAGGPPISAGESTHLQVLKGPHSAMMESAGCERFEPRGPRRVRTAPAAGLSRLGRLVFKFPSSIPINPATNLPGKRHQCVQRNGFNKVLVENG